MRGEPAVRKSTEGTRTFNAPSGAEEHPAVHEALCRVVESYARRFLLSRREREVLSALVVYRMDSKTTADKLAISYPTVRQYWSRICTKTGTDSSLSVVLDILDSLCE